MKSPKTYTAIHNENGDKFQFAWNGNSAPNDEDVEKMKEMDKTVRSPFPSDSQDSDPSNDELRDEESPENSVRNPMENSDSESDQEPDSDDENGGDEESNNDVNEEGNNFVDYHKSLSDLANEPDNYGHLFHVVAKGKAAGIDPKEVHDMLLAHGVNEERAKAVHDLLST